jgi:hypothetical protein
VSNERDLDAWLASFPNSPDEVTIKRWVEDGKLERAEAIDKIIRAARQISASRLLNQPTQERIAENALFEGIRELESSMAKRIR